MGLNRLPAWLRWSLYATVVVLVLGVVESFEPGEASRLTAPTASQAMLRWSTPILLAGLGGLYSERCGVVNIGLEGMMVLGTWFGAWGAIAFNPWAGLVCGLVGGALGGLLHAVATVGFGVDHIISGVAVNIMAPGVTTFLSTVVFGNRTQSDDLKGLGSFDVPLLASGLARLRAADIFLLSDLAGLSEGLVSGLGVFTLLSLALVPVSGWILWRTRFGLQLRSAGENPEAGESLGVNVYFRQYCGVIISGALAGLGGAYIAMELTGFYQTGQTGGRGYIGLAALIFGNWRPVGVLMAALLFGYPSGIALRDLDNSSTHALLLVIAIAMVGLVVWAVRARRRSDALLASVLACVMFGWYVFTATAPDWLPNAMPYVLVLLVLVFASQRLRMPASAGRIYRKGGA